MLNWKPKPGQKKARGGVVIISTVLKLSIIRKRVFCMVVSQNSIVEMIYKIFGPWFIDSLSENVL